MGSPATLELDDLVQPISDDQPTGEDLRLDLSPNTVYYQIKDIRTAARNSERQGEFDPVVGAAEAAAWRPILGPGAEVLKTRAKDLEVVAWMMEALLRTDGFAGLRDGIRLARELVERFWDGLYPMPDEDGIETRVAPLAGLSLHRAGTLIAPIARIPITQGSSLEPLATWSCRQAAELERLSDDARQERMQQGATSQEQVEAAVRETSPEFFASLVSDVSECLQEWQLLGEALDQVAGADSPPSTHVREALTQVLDTIKHVAKDRLPAEAAEIPAAAAAAEPADGPTAPAAPVAPAPTPAPGTIQSREDAFRALDAIAEYFRENEPHSPLSFLVERTIRWGKLPLPELLAELIPDESARDTYSQLTGVANQNAD